MIKKLRVKFIRLSVLVLAAALILLVAVINAANWFSVRQDIIDTSDELAASVLDDVWHGRGKNQKNKNGEAFYESRYFTVTTDKKGNLSCDLSNVSTYTQADAESLAQTALAADADSGFLGSCYYHRYTADSRSAVLFLDVGSRLTRVRQLVIISLICCAAGILLAWLIMVLFSRRAIQPVLENTEKQKRFITDASHELKTPLSVISANMDVLEMDVPDNEWISSTRRQVGLMNRMVRGMVLLSRADEGAQQAEFSDFDLSQLIRDTAEPFIQMAEAGGRTFTVTAPEKYPARGEAQGISHLISVLCDNAVKYSPENDALTLTLSRKGAYTLIETENTPAEPIPDDKLKHLFDRFYRADESRTKKSEKTGFGLGLAIAQAVCESHSGSAEATMQNGRLRITCKLKL